MFRRHRNDESYDRLTRRNYSKGLRKAKRESWKNFCEDADDPTKTARINKIITQRANQTLNIIKRSDGSFCESPDESLDTLVNVHFPGSTELQTAESISERVCCISSFNDIINVVKENL